MTGGLFDDIPEESPRERQWRKWRVFHRENPHVYSLFEHYVFEAIASGRRRRFGARAVWERMRWYLDFETTDATEYKLNDHYPPYYARHFMKMHPEHKGLFELRGDEDE